jgi:two-component system phosphate regulon sensor histidine kinase PhoR
MNQPIQLSSLLAERRVEILERWTQRIAWEHADKNLSHGELQDHLPLFFEQVLTALGVAETHDTVVPTASAAHGTQRLRVGFDLAEVIREYEILTECILDEVEAVAGSITTRAFRSVQALLNKGRAEAVSAYIERRDAEEAHAHSQHMAFIAHELRSPLTTAFLVASALQKKVRPEDDTALSMLVRNLTAMRELINQVLTADRLAGNVPLTRETLDLRSLLEEVLADARLVAERNHVQLILEAPEPLPFQGDRRLLRSAITNLVGNGVKFTHEGRAIIVSATRAEGHITIAVEDGCGGLPEGNAAELFEPFVQRGEDRTGFGLGLAIVKQALEAHGGSALVRNLPGRGCVFSLELPEINE